VSAGSAAAFPAPDPGAPARGLRPPPASRGVVPPGSIVFPIVGALTSWHDDFGEARPIDREEGNDIGTNPHTPVVAAVSGKIERMWWGGAGWTLRLTAQNGDQYLYIHLGINGKPATAYVAGLKNGDHVTQGEQIAWSGYSGNASIDFPHVEFQFLPGGGKPVDPYQYLIAAPRLLFPAPHVARGQPRTPLRLALAGTLSNVSQDGSGGSMTMSVTSAQLSSGGPLKLRKPITLKVPAAAVILRQGIPVTVDRLEANDVVSALSAPLRPTVAQQLGAANAIPVARVDAAPAPVPH
jgi:hypothetical protein